MSLTITETITLACSLDPDDTLEVTLAPENDKDDSVRFRLVSADGDERSLYVSLEDAHCFAHAIIRMAAGATRRTSKCAVGA